MQNLVDTPRIGRPVEDMTREISELIFGRYIVRYEVCGNTMDILRVWHGEEDR